MRALLALALCLASCAPTEPGSVEAVAWGRDLVADPTLSSSGFNPFACTTCHPPTAGSSLLPGAPLEGIAARQAWWGGTVVRLVDAADFCFRAFMRSPDPLDPTDPRWRAVDEYLASVSPGPTQATLPFTVVRNVTDVPRGEVARGHAVYTGACAVCHGALKTGDGRLRPLVPVLPNVTREYGKLFPGTSPALVVIEKVRHGQSFGVGGTMPPYALERLSDADLGALLTALGL